MADLNIVVATIVSALLLFLRDSRWLTTTLRWVVGVTLAAAGIAGFILTINGEKGTPTPQCQVLVVPLLTVLIDYAFKSWSMRLQGRDFHLYSGQIDMSEGRIPDYITRTDMAFTFAATGVIIVMIVTACLMFRYY
ncbi:MAG TPA: hypothetical protein VHM26_17890 [Chitinophagaceae bacterium]|jgi:hypothetical protein|nr:hypothetical protein [Chitinophagaceae bacterium]